MNKQGNRILVGFFTAGALVILLGFGVFTGGFSNLRNKNERFVLVFNENVYGLHEGGKVTLNGVRIGRVERFFIGDELEKGPVPVLVEINRKLVERHMILEGNEVFDSEGKFKKEVLNRLMGQLVQESFVTGILYVNLTTENSVSVKSALNTLHGYPEISTKGLNHSSHISPHSSDEENRLNPKNGLLLSMLIHKCFDEGIISIDDNYRIILSDSIKDKNLLDYLKKYENKKINLPIRKDFYPDKKLLKIHREKFGFE